MQFLLAVLILIILYLILSKIQTNQENFESLNSQPQPKKIYLVRIIGNTMPNINDPDQNLNNLKYILENEQNLPNIEKIWILNRIVDKNMEKKYEKLLNENNKYYEKIEFNKAEFMTKLNSKLITLKNLTQNMNAILYLTNINGARNYALKRFRTNCDYVMVFDSNIFLPNNSLTKINNLCSTSNFDYILTPIKRVNEYKNIEDIEKIPNGEPQIIFSKNSTLTFNEEIPYGYSNKVELLNVIGVKGAWNNWKDNERLNIISRKSDKKYNFKTVAYVVRLPSLFKTMRTKNITQTERSDAMISLCNSLIN
jgi:hypothetical protein